MNYPHRRDTNTYIHVDTATDNFKQLNKSMYKINLNSKNDDNIPIDEITKITKIELEVFKFKELPRDKNGALCEYVFLKIKNIDGKTFSNTPCQNSTTVIYTDGLKPIYFGSTSFEFDPCINLRNLEVEMRDSNNDLIANTDHSFVLKISHVEGNLY